MNINLRFTVGILALTAWSGMATAGQIVVSGDITPVFFLTDTSPNDAEPGNQTFFENVLGAGTGVAVLNTSNNTSASAEVDEFFGGLAGVTSTLLAGPVSAGDLSAVDLFVAPAPDTAFTASEITALSNFLNGGGTVFLMGEADNIPFGSATNVIINSLLTGLGSGLALIDANLDIGTNQATGGQIANHPLTSGVTEFFYGFSSEVDGGTPLFFSQNGTAFLSFEETVIPEPATVLSFGTGLLVLAGVHARRRRRAAKAA